MDLPYSPEVISPRPLVEAIANANHLSRFRPNWRLLAISTARAAAGLFLLAFSVLLFTAGLLLTSLTLLLAIARFTGASIGAELMAQCICSMIVATWGSGVCWEKMREFFGARE